MKNSRRTFMMTVAAGGAAITLGAHAQTMVDEKSPQAAALGYAADTTQVDAKKYPRHAATQLCNNCALYQGKASDAAAACALFPGKQVAGKGWCNAWAKKG